ncbi:hypothetical protein GN956_G2962 [Arapaima gigas]
MLFLSSGETLQVLPFKERGKISLTYQGARKRRSSTGEPAEAEPTLSGQDSGSPCFTQRLRTCYCVTPQPDM